jgi:RimJ/RimL family protein N-acetyltransferase
MPEDALDVLRWRNNPLVREMSRSHAPIPKQAHLAWYADSLENAKRLLLIGTAGEVKVGMARFDRQPLSVWEASIMLAPEFRGRGLGKDLLRAGIERLEALHGPTAVLAVIRISNAASIHLFESLGFILIGSDGEFWRYRRPPSGNEKALPPVQESPRERKKNPEHNT